MPTLSASLREWNFCDFKMICQSKQVIFKLYNPTCGGWQHATLVPHDEPPSIQQNKLHFSCSSRTPHLAWQNKFYHFTSQPHMTSVFLFKVIQSVQYFLPKTPLCLQILSLENGRSIFAKQLKWGRTSQHENTAQLVLATNRSCHVPFHFCCVCCCFSSCAGVELVH